jgi:hypothetical protein
MSAEDIGLYLRMNAGEGLCGRFRKDQLDVELPTADEYIVQVLRAPLPYLKRIAAIVLFALFIAVPNYTADAKGNRKVKHHSSHTTKHPTVKHQILLGKVAAPVVDTSADKHSRIMGDVMLRPDPPEVHVQGGVQMYCPEVPGKKDRARVMFLHLDCR